MKHRYPRALTGFQRDIEPLRDHEEPQPEGDYLDLRAKYKDGVIRFSHKHDNPLPNLKIDIYNLRGQRVSSKSFAEGGSNTSLFLL